MKDHAKKAFLRRKKSPIKFIITLVQDYMHLRSRGFCRVAAFNHAKNQF
jgi:hypothetical protein